MGKAKLFYTFFFFLHFQLSRCDVHSISWYFLGHEGLKLPSYTERIVVNDVTLFHYDSNMKSTTPCPEWLNSTDGQQHWKKTSSLSHHNRAHMAEALHTAIGQFNLTGTLSSINVYQGYSRCDIYPNGTIKASLTHAFNGKDFLSLDIENKRFIASVPQALIYKRIRETNIILLETMVSFYKTTCFDRLKIFLDHTPSGSMTKAPEVRIFERQRAGSMLLTCHVTGFYPKEVQVKWIGADIPQVDDEMNDVLPNGDGTYQIRKSVVIPEEITGDQHYSCVVEHSSVKENITVTRDKGVKPFRLPVWIILGSIFLVIVAGFAIRYICRRRELL